MSSQTSRANSKSKPSKYILIKQLLIYKDMKLKPRFVYMAIWICSPSKSELSLGGWRSQEKKWVLKITEFNAFSIHFEVQKEGTSRRAMLGKLSLWLLNSNTSYLEKGFGWRWREHGRGSWGLPAWWWGEGGHGAGFEREFRDAHEI